MLFKDLSRFLVLYESFSTTENDRLTETEKVENNLLKNFELRI